MIRNYLRLLAVGLIASSALAQDPVNAWGNNPKLKMATTVDAETGHRITRGTYTVWRIAKLSPGAPSI